jgi:hypothetical protein
MSACSPPDGGSSMRKVPRENQISFIEVCEPRYGARAIEMQSVRRICRKGIRVGGGRGRQKRVLGVSYTSRELAQKWRQSTHRGQTGEVESRWSRGRHGQRRARRLSRQPPGTQLSLVAELDRTMGSFQSLGTTRKHFRPRTPYQLVPFMGRLSLFAISNSTSPCSRIATRSAWLCST